MNETTADHHAGCDLAEKTGDSCTCGAEATDPDFTGPAWVAYAEASAAETALRVALDETLKKAERRTLSLRGAAFAEVGEEGVHAALCEMEAKNAR